MRFAKIVGHARPPEKLSAADAGLSLFSAEDFAVEFGETHSYRTGIVLEIPPGKVGLLLSNAGTSGLLVVGGLLTAGGSATELRVPLANVHRNAVAIKSGQALCQLVLLDADEDTAEEFDRVGLTNELVEAKAKVQAEDLKRKEAAKAKTK